MKPYPNPGQHSHTVGDEVMRAASPVRDKSLVILVRQSIEKTQKKYGNPDLPRRFVRKREAGRTAQQKPQNTVIDKVENFIDRRESRDFKKRNRAGDRRQSKNEGRIQNDHEPHDGKGHQSSQLKFRRSFLNSALFKDSGGRYSAAGSRTHQSPFLLFSSKFVK